MNKKEDIVYLYVKQFSYKQKDDLKNMGGHPMEGRVYRSIKSTSPKEYKIHVGEEKTLVSVDGIKVKGLKCNNKDFECELIEITDDNILNLPLIGEDLALLNTWEDEGNKSLLDLVNGEGEEIKTTKRKVNIDESEPVDEISMEDLKELINTSFNLDSVTDQKTNLISEHDEEMATVVDDIADYVLSTYEDKYANSPIPSGPFIVSEYGKGFNCGNSLKYLSRYCTEGYAKSNDVKDLFKAVHYILFEIKRRYING